MVLVGSASDSEPLRPLADVLRKALGPALHSLHWNGNPERTNVILGPHWQRLFGPEATRETIGGAGVFFPPGAFGQANLDAADRIVARIHSWVSSGQRIVELYAGCGPIGLGLLARSAGVTFVESAPASVRGLALGLAERPEAERARAKSVAADAGSVPELLRGADLVIADPPRSGIDAAALDALAASPPRALIYLSCDLGTFETQAERLTREGAAARRARRLRPLPEHRARRDARAVRAELARGALPRFEMRAVPLRREEREPRRDRRREPERPDEERARHRGGRIEAEEVQHRRSDRDRRSGGHREAPEPDAVGDDGVADAEPLPEQERGRWSAASTPDQSIATAVRRLIATIAAPSLPIAPAAKPGVMPCHAKQPRAPRRARGTRRGPRRSPGRNTRQLKTPSDPAEHDAEVGDDHERGADVEVERHRLPRHRGERVAEAAHQEEAEAEDELRKAARARREQQHARAHDEAHEDEGRTAEDGEDPHPVLLPSG